jgi:hypothetical protein
MIICHRSFIIPPLHWKQILLYGSDVQLYNEKAFQNNIKSISMYPAHIYTTQYKETKLHQSSRKIFGAPDVHPNVL